MSLKADDLQNIKGLFKITIDEDETLVRKSDISYLPTKDDFYNEMDKLMGELKTVREEITILSDTKRQVNNHEEKLAKIEEKLQIKPTIA